MTLLAATACADPCVNELPQEVYSEARDWKAVVFLRNCGATMGYQVMVSLLPAGEELPRGRGNVFAAAPTSAHPGTAEAHVVWKDNHRLVVSYDGGILVEKKVTEFRGVVIDYDPR